MTAEIVDTAPRVHPTALIEDGAEFGQGVVIGPYCIVGPEVRLGSGVVLESHLVVTGRTEIGQGSRIFPFASIGDPPQDLKYHGEASELVIGSNTVIREHVTMNPGTEGGGMLTRVGDAIASSRARRWASSGSSSGMVGCSLTLCSLPRRRATAGHY